MNESEQEVKPTSDAEIKVNVSYSALREVLNALVGPPHYIRELQVTRGLPGHTNAIDLLIEEFNAEVTRIASETKNNETNDGSDQTPSPPL